MNYWEANLYTHAWGHKTDLTIVGCQIQEFRILWRSGGADAALGDFGETGGGWSGSGQVENESRQGHRCASEAGPRWKWMGHTNGLAFRPLFINLKNACSNMPHVVARMKACVHNKIPTLYICTVFNQGCKVWLWECFMLLDNQNKTFKVLSWADVWE